MPTGRPQEYVLFHPTKRAANKALAVRLALHHLGGTKVDASTIETPDWGVCHIAAYTDTLSALVAASSTTVKFGEVDWHSKGRMILVREQPRKSRSPARLTIYVNDIEPLFGRITVGLGGVKWTGVSKLKLYSKTFDSMALEEDLAEAEGSSDAEAETSA